MFQYIYNYNWVKWNYFKVSINNSIVITNILKQMLIVL